MVAIIQIIRYVAAYLQYRLQHLKQQNACVKIIFCTIQCCVQCLESIVKFVSRNAYIMCALYGKGFCTSTKMSFVAIRLNIAQVATVTFLGKLKNYNVS